MTYDVPFISNTPDDKHCSQASFMMIAKYFDSSFAITMYEWSQLTGFEPGKGTWANASVLWFQQHGYEVTHFEVFDHEAFLADPAAYLIQFAGREVGEWQIVHTNIPAEVERIKALLACGALERRQPTMYDVKRFLDDGYLLRVNVNLARLNDKPGYTGHSVAIIGYDDTGLIFHDPGLPAVPSRHESFEKFEAAWADPNPDAKELDAIKLATATA